MNRMASRARSSMFLTMLPSVPLLGALSGCGGEDRTRVELGPLDDVVTKSEAVTDALEIDAANEANVGSPPHPPQAVSIDEVASSAWPRPSLEWSPCQNGFECADALVPRNYANPHGPKYRVALTRLLAQDPVRRIGPLFFNFGGPGGGAVAALQAFGAQAFATLNERFDLVGFDPRGTGSSEAPIDCHVDQESEGLYAKPFMTPLNLDVDFWTARAQNLVDACVSENGDVLAIAATANVARDMDMLRAALGEEKLSYLGFSYGTFLGATYAALFPHHYRALVLDGGLDPDAYINRPSEALRAQTAGFERALDRFFEACAADPAACLDFGGDDPHLAFDQLVDDANLSPIAVPGSDRPLDGDDIVFATSSLLYSKFAWPFLAEALSSVQNGDPTLMKLVADSSYGRNDDGTYSPSTDRYFALGATEQAYAPDRDRFLVDGYSAWAEYDHFFFNTGYTELPLGLFPVHSTGVFRGPFVASPDAPTILVVGTTYDPATPYRGTRELARQLGNARLLTMLGDGHTAYGGNSACIDSAVESYLTDGTLPDVGSECSQEVPFEAATESDPGDPNEAAALITPDALHTPSAMIAANAIRLLYRGRFLSFGSR
jgi:pimeloyl-ACP methyl ester carboxylesterase